MMDRALIEQHLAQAERHVAEGEGQIARQKETVSELERDEHVKAAQKARELLAVFELAQETLVGDRDRLLAELAACK